MADRKKLSKPAKKKGGWYPGKYIGKAVSGIKKGVKKRRLKRDVKKATSAKTTKSIQVVRQLQRIRKHLVNYLKKVLK